MTTQEGKLRCDYCGVTLSNNKKYGLRTLFFCMRSLTLYPFYPVEKSQVMNKECQECSDMFVSCVECGADITERARTHGRVHYCNACRLGP